MTTLAGVAVLAYLLGSIPFSYLVARRAGVADVRKVGSGNVGATNVLRSVGKGAGAAALLLDSLKGFGAVWLGQSLDAPAGGSVAAAAAVLGHVFPLWLAFQGGKGVATGAGAFLPLAPVATGAALLVFAVTAAASGFVSLGSVAAALALAGLCFATGVPPQVAWTALGVALLIVWKHRGNLARIVRGVERRFGRG